MAWTGFTYDLRRFLRGEEATATLEFVIVFPVVIILFIAVFETAMILTRQVMLERALDRTVRVLRLTSDLTTTHSQIAQTICADALVIPDCFEVLTLDLRVIDQGNFTLPEVNALCVDRDGDVSPANTFQPGVENDLMLVRVCAVVDRILPFSGFGLNLTRDDFGGVHMTAASIFVNEPD